MSRSLPTNNPGLPLQEIEGTLERITFQNNENGYLVGHLTLKSRNEEVTIVGSLAGVSVGASLRIRGLWTTHTQYGKQFEIHSYTTLLPATLVGIRKYLGSGLIKGIGPMTAARIVETFGLDTLAVIEETPHRLQEVPGMGEKRSGWITQAWESQKQIKEIMLFLQSHGVSTSLAVKIFKQYGNTSIQVVKNDPYRLAKDIYGIGFKTADKIALNMGLTLDSPARLQAGLLFTLSSLNNDGHCFATREQLLRSASEILEVSQDLCGEPLEALIRQNEVIAEEEAIYLPPFYYAEQGVANRIQRIHTSPRDRLGVFAGVDWEKAFAWLDEMNETAGKAIHLTGQQKSAIQMALSQKVSVLTGGPGYRQEHHHRQPDPPAPDKAMHCSTCSSDRSGGPPLERSHRFAGQDHSPLAGI